MTTAHDQAAREDGPESDTERRVTAIDWARVETDLDVDGHAVIRELFTPDECARVTATYHDGARFRSKVVMNRHGYGSGEYQYFAYPLPEPIATFRTRLYEPLARVANRWGAMTKNGATYPERHADYLEICHAAGQTRPTPLLLRYGAGDYNRLHQDLYGEQVFPLQVAVLLSEPGRDFAGGEFVLTEQRPRMQSRVMVVPLRLGDAVVFAVHHRPIQGIRGTYRVTMRHGVSRVISGSRHTLGIIFHDAT